MLLSSSQNWAIFPKNYLKNKQLSNCYKCFCWCFLLFSGYWATGQHDKKMHPDETDHVLEKLQEAREGLVLLPHADWSIQIAEMLETGLWEIAFDSLQKHQDDPKGQWLLAEYYFLNHEYQQSEKLLEVLLPKTPSDTELKRSIQLLFAKLQLQAWRLEDGLLLLEQLRNMYPDDAEINYWIGKYFLYTKRYDDAVSLGYELQERQPKAAEGYLLEAEARLWMRQIDLAKVLLMQALEREPYLADARFWYGYAIWREIDAAKLPQMAEQWKIALELNPLHYLTHWHWGNGHTQLTYQDYTDPSDGDALSALIAMDELLGQRKYPEALAKGKEIEITYPRSVHPAMFRGSCFYNLAMLNEQYLDSALFEFRHVLEFRGNYGGAHNGIAAVIKKKQFAYLEIAKTLEQEIEGVEIPEQWQPIFASVFPDVNQYPTDRAKKMVWSQLFASKAYLPMLQLLERRFVIPPLHIDLATAMNNEWFKTGVVFDNRQWMDIRGVGSGAAGIEYVERGAHFERNVTLHEFAHLFHFTILTETEKSRILALYYQAMKEGKAIDYYSENNDAEYFAQAYTAYFSEKRIHPQNHKSVNTKYDLKTKDPAMYAFVDSLVKRTERSMEGDETALASNWAQAYVTKAEAGKRLAGWGFETANRDKAKAYYQKALTYDPNYLPAKLGIIALQLSEGKFKAGEVALNTLLKENPSYGPAYLLQAELVSYQVEKGEIEVEQGRKLKTKSFKKAYEFAADWQQKGRMYDLLLRYYHDHTMFAEGIALAKRYAQSIAQSEFIKPLKAARNQALGYAFWQEGKLGYTDEALTVLQRLTMKHPDNAVFLKQYAEVLANSQQYAVAIHVLQRGLRFQKNLRDKNDISLQIAEYQLYIHDKEGAKKTLGDLANQKAPNITDFYRLVRVVAFTGKPEKAKKLLASQKIPLTEYGKAEYAFAQAKIAQAASLEEDAISALKTVLVHNPYHIEASIQLIRMYRLAKNKELARQVVQGLKRTELPPSGKIDQLLWELTK